MTRGKSFAEPSKQGVKQLGTEEFDERGLRVLNGLMQGAGTKQGLCRERRAKLSGGKLFWMRAVEVKTVSLSQNARKTWLQPDHWRKAKPGKIPNQSIRMTRFMKTGNTCEQHVSYSK